MRSDKTSVLIVGGGLVGLSAAMFLGYYGIDTIVVERHHTTSKHPKARGVNPRTMEIFSQFGAVEPILATESARSLKENSGITAVTSLAGEEIEGFRGNYTRERDDDFSEVTTARWALCDQDELEPVLAEQARKADADIRFGNELLSFDEHPDSITGKVRDERTGDLTTIKAKYLVIADGANSPLRKQLGIQMEGPGTLAHYMSIYFTADLAHALGDRRFILCYVLNDEVRGSLVPVNNNDRWMLHVPFDPANGQSPQDFTEENCVKLVRAAAGIPELSPNILAVLPWEAAGGTASRWRVGRAFLAGDAAHVMPPTGAFGSNTGVQDVYNLAWKLSAVLRGEASSVLLESYEAERLPVAQATVQQAVLRSKDRSRVHAQGDSADASEIVSDLDVMFGYRYPSDSYEEGRTKPVWASPGSTLVAGTRLPHFPLEVNGLPISSVYLAQRDLTLVAGPSAEHWLECLNKVRARTKVSLPAWRIGPESSTLNNRNSCGTAVDTQAQWGWLPGLTNESVLLLRPDGFVGWVSDARSADMETTLVQAVERVLYDLDTPVGPGKTPRW